MRLIVEGLAFTLGMMLVGAVLALFALQLAKNAAAL